MQSKKIQNKGQARLFKNKYLEMLTKTHPLFIWALYLPIMTYFIFYSKVALLYPWPKIAFVFGVAVFFWTFFEYIAHRFIFHWISKRSFIKHFAYILHGNHHHYPRDKQRLFMPLVPSILIASILFLLFFAIFLNLTFVFFPGFITGYLLYASMHYAIHACAPPFKWLKPLWRNHHLHHYKNDTLGFGVSSTFWDRLFGTMSQTKESS